MNAIRILIVDENPRRHKYCYYLTWMPPTDFQKASDSDQK